eukprot:3464634-Alexandrium_andersonii.AAC.1
MSKSLWCESEANFQGVWRGQPMGLSEVPHKQVDFGPRGGWRVPVGTAGNGRARPRVLRSSRRPRRDQHPPRQSKHGGNCLSAG